jgi:uncharacterized membrane protein
MTFLNPAILFGLLAAGIPIVIHLLNLRKLKKIEFSTLIFLKELKKNKIRKIQLKQWLLLALRILVILFLVLAFSRPTIKGISIGGTTSLAKTTAVFILDDTYSMSVVGDNGSYFNQAKSLLRSHLEQLHEGDDAAIILLSDVNQQTVPLSKDITSLKKELEDIHLSSVSGYLHPAIVKAASLFGTSNNFNKELYLFTDMQKTELMKDSAYSNLSELMNERVNIYLFPFTGKDIFNIGIDSVKLNTVVLGKDKPFQMSVYLTNYSNTDSKNTIVSLFLNGERTAQKGIAIEKHKSMELQLESTFKKSGLQEIVAEIDDDAIALDNTAYSAVLVPDKINIGIFENDKNDSRFLRLALEAGDSTRTFVFDERNITQLSSVNIMNYDAIFVFGSSRNFAGDKLLQYTATRGNIFIIPGQNTTADDFNHTLSALSLPECTGLRKANDKSWAYEELSTIDFTHPLLRGIFKNSSAPQIESPQFYSHFILKNDGTAESIVTLSDKSVLLSEYKRGHGKILVLATALNPEWTNFPYKSFFVPFAFSSVFYLTARQDDGVQNYTGQPIPIQLNRSMNGSVKITRPDKTEEILHIDDKATVSGLKYDKTNIPGNYKILSDKNVENVISVNHNPIESSTEAYSESDFATYLSRINFKGHVKTILPQENGVEKIKEARFGTELWKLFIILALITSLVEMWVSHSSKNDLASTE